MILQGSARPEVRSELYEELKARIWHTDIAIFGIKAYCYYIYTQALHKWCPKNWQPFVQWFLPSLAIFNNWYSIGIFSNSRDSYSLRLSIPMIAKIGKLSFNSLCRQYTYYHTLYILLVAICTCAWLSYDNITPVCKCTISIINVSII